MAILTAGQLKDRERPEFLIDLGNGQEVLVRAPDLQLLVLKNLLPTPLLAEVVKMVGQWAGAGITDLTEEVIAKSDKLVAFVDTYVCACMLDPKVVLTAEELVDGALTVADLTLNTKKRIVMEVTAKVAAAQREVAAAATEFPEGGPGAGSGPDVQALQPEAV